MQISIEFDIAAHGLDYDLPGVCPSRFSVDVQVPTCVLARRTFGQSIGHPPGILNGFSC